MAEITLSPETRTTLHALQRTNALINRANTRIATGLKVKSPLDDAKAFFVAKSLTNRAEDLLRVKDDINSAASTVGAALVAIDGVTDLIGQLKSLALSAKGKSDQEAAGIAVQFDEIRGQIDSLVNDATFNFTNLLSASPDDLAVKFNEDGSSTLTVSGVASDSSSLGIGSAVDDHDNFNKDKDVDDAVQDLDAALVTLRSTASTLGSNDSLIDVRLEFTESLVKTLQEGAAKLTNADVTEEAANLLALEARFDLGLATVLTESKTLPLLLGLLESR